MNTKDNMNNENSPAITANNVWDKLWPGRTSAGKNNMPNIGAGLHFCISDKVSSFLIWLQKFRSNLARIDIG